MIAIIGASASGKSDLAFKIAQNFNGYILSLDSLSVYKQIDIASAKPSKKDLSDIKHFGVDEICVGDSFSIMEFIDIFKIAKEQSIKDNKLLIIAGGSSFYLKSMIDGISVLPSISHEVKERAKLKSKNIDAAYEFLYKLDKNYMRNIKPNDRYRITRAYEIHLSTGSTMSAYFKKHPRISVIEDIDIYNLDIPKDALLQKVETRTRLMLERGLLDEVRALLEQYEEGMSPMKSIGIKECVAFLKQPTSVNALREEIIINTMKLAKRQKTFNKTQFQNITNGSYQELFEVICTKLKQ